MNELSPANFRDVAATVTRTRGWGALTGNEVNLVGFGEPVRIGGTAVTANVRTGSRRAVGDLRGIACDHPGAVDSVDPVARHFPCDIALVSE